MRTPRDPETLPRGSIARLVGAAAGIASASVGLLMTWVGAGALLPPTREFAAVPSLLLAVGVLTTLATVASGPGGFVSDVRRATPQLYPFGSKGVQLALLALLLVGTVSIAHGIFDIFTSADTGLAADSAAGQASSDALLTAASAVLWVLTIYAILAMRRVIQMGRRIDTSTGPDAYGQPRMGPESSGDDTVPGPSPASPAARGSTAAIAGVSLVLALGISAGIQTLEVNLGPAPALSWAFAQLLTPLYVVPFVMAVSAIDRGIRDLEAEYVRVLTIPPVGDARAALALIHTISISSAPPSSRGRMVSLLDSSRARGYRSWGRRSMVVGLVVLLVGVSYSGAHHPGPTQFTSFSAGQPPGGGTHVTNLSVNLTDGPAFDPANLAVPAGNVLTLDVANHGLFNHSFTLVAQAGVILSPRLSPSELNAFFRANGSLANVTVVPGGSQLASITFPPTAQPGSSFEFVSWVPYQFQAGMRGFINLTGAPTGPGQQLSDQATDTFRFVPDNLGVMPSTYPATIDVKVMNAGSNSHTWTLEGQPNETLNPGNFSQYFSSHPPAARASLPGAGDVVWANFTISGPGIYEFICEISGHFVNGMFGFLYVGLPLPANVTPPSTAIVQEGILIGAGSLLGIGVLFALAGSFLGRMPRRPSGPSY